jgi:hypothetical protein
MDSSRTYAINECGAVLLQNGSYLTNENITVWFNDKGEYHRENGPAVIYKNNHSLWFNHGVPLLFKNWLIQSNTTDEQKLLLRLQYG